VATLVRQYRSYLYKLGMLITHRHPLNLTTHVELHMTRFPIAPRKDSTAPSAEPQMSVPTNEQPSGLVTVSRSLLATLVSALLNLTVVFAGKHGIKLTEAWGAVLSNLSEAVDTVESRLKEMGMEVPVQRPETQFQTTKNQEAKVQEPKTPVRSRLPVPKKSLTSPSLKRST